MCYVVNDFLSFPKNFKTTFSNNTAGRILLILSDYSLKISRTSFNPLTDGGSKQKVIHTLATLSLRPPGLFKYVSPFVTTNNTSLKITKTTKKCCVFSLEEHMKLS